MAWHRLIARLAFPCSLVLACHDEEKICSDSTCDPLPPTGDNGESTATTTAATDTGSGSTTTPTTAAESSTAPADSTTSPPEPVACGDVMCDPGQVCVVPCCGGPMPGCYEQPPGGECSKGDAPDEFGARCCINDPTPTQCMMTSWCIPGPCMPDPMYCAPGETVSCTGNDCTVEGGCSGMLFEDGVLHCEDCK